MNTSIAEFTHGEQRVLQALKRLPERQYYFKHEPRLNTDGHNSKPDFVVIDALRGVIIIEVKDWVEIVSADQKTFVIRKRDGEKEEFPNPYSTAERYAYDLDRLFKTKPELWARYKGKERLLFPWQPMVILPNIQQIVIEQMEAKAVIPAHCFIGGEMLKSITALEQAIANLPWRFKITGTFTRDIREIIRGIIDPSIVVEDQNGQQVGPLTITQENLVKESLRLFASQQLALPVENTPPSESTSDLQIRLIRGVAGSGKTLVILKRARWIRETHPDAEILLLTFNRELADTLERRLGDNCRVINFHRLCAEILRDIWHTPLNKRNWLEKNMASEIEDLKLPREFVADELTWRVEEGLLTDDSYLAADRTGRGYRLDKSKRQIINQIFKHYGNMKKNNQQSRRNWFDWEDIPFLVEERLQKVAHPYHGKYDTILVDEAQDFTPSWMRVVKLLVKPGGFLSLCDDPTQGIFHNYNWKQKNIPVVGRTTILRIPFRSTFEISSAAHALIDADEILNKSLERTLPDFTSYELFSGTVPELLVCGNAVNEHLAVVNRVENLIDDDIPTSQIAILCHHWSLIDQWRDLVARGVYVNSFDKTKGLEFQAVFVPHLHSFFSPEDDVEIISAKRRKVFMAMTRARHSLYISVQATVSDALSPILGSVSVNNIGL